MECLGLSLGCEASAELQFVHCCVLLRSCASSADLSLAVLVKVLWRRRVKSSLHAVRADVNAVPGAKGAFESCFFKECLFGFWWVSENVCDSAVCL